MEDRMTEVIPDAAVEAALEAFYAKCDVDFDGLAAVRAALEAAAPHLELTNKVKLAAIIVALDQYAKVTKWMETIDETGEYADEAIGKIRDILEGAK
jgi:hypothetical protein